MSTLDTITLWKDLKKLSDSYRETCGILSEYVEAQKEINEVLGDAVTDLLERVLELEKQKEVIDHDNEKSKAKNLD